MATKLARWMPSALRHLALLEAGIVLDKEDDGEIGRAQALGCEGFPEILEDCKLCAAKPIANRFAQD